MQLDDNQIRIISDGIKMGFGVEDIAILLSQRDQINFKDALAAVRAKIKEWRNRDVLQSIINNG